MRVATLLVFVMVVLSAATVSAQTPFIAVYFDNTFQTESTINPGGCPGIGTLDTLYIAMTNANVFVSGVDFAVNYPPELNWISDILSPLEIPRVVSRWVGRLRKTVLVRFSFVACSSNGCVTRVQVQTYRCRSRRTPIPFSWVTRTSRTSLSSQQWG